MSESLLIFIGILVITQAVVIIDVRTHCSCEELRENECGFLNDVCKWTTTCETIEQDCSRFTESSKCDAEDTGYKCGWEDSKCVEKDYLCSDFTTNKTCPVDINCYWNKQGKCDSFSSCDQYDKDNCTHYGCKVNSNNECVSFTCSSIKEENDCQGRDSETTECAWANNGECKQLALSASCPDFGDFKKKCLSSQQYDNVQTRAGKNRYTCKYEDNKCSFPKCSHYSGDSCDTAPIGKYERVICVDNGQGCTEATDASEISQKDCFKENLFLLRWSDEEKCQQCSETVPYDPSMNAAAILSIFIVFTLIA